MVVVGILALSGWAWATTTYRVTDTHVAPAVEAAQGLLAPFVEPSPLCKGDQA